MERVIHVDLDILGGTPVFWGTRVPVKNLFDYKDFEVYTVVEMGWSGNFIQDEMNIKQ